MGSSLSELKKEARKLGIPVFPSAARAPYLDALRAHHLRRDFPNGLPYQELCPMQCFNFWDLRPKQQEILWKSDEWLVQEKLNGVRLILHFVKGLGIFAHTRTTSVRTYRRTEVTNHLLVSGFKPEFTAAIDCEACDKRGLQSTLQILHMEVGASRTLQREQGNPLKFHVFDVATYDEKDLRQTKLYERLLYLADFQASIKETELGCHFEFPEVHLQGKHESYERILENGGEGVVFKNLNSCYEDNSSRSRLGWVKLKRQLEFDSYVSGFERGGPGSRWEICVSALLFSVYTEQGSRVIAKISNLPWSLRKRISLYDAKKNELKLGPNCLGRVARISGLEMSRRAFRLVHPRILYWRSDLSLDQCTYSSADLQALRMGRTSLPLRILAR